MSLSVGSETRPGPNSGEPVNYGFLRVVDTGIGMTPELQSRIFEPFFTTKPAGQGTGLGLSIIHGIVKDHQGMIELKSAPGKGSGFTVLIPACAPPEPTEEDESPGVPQPGRGELIILAHARSFVREIMASSLISLGYGVIQVADGQGLEHALQSQPRVARVLVLDMESMGRDARGLLAQGSGAGLGVVAILDAPDATIPSELPRAAVLQKPFQMPELAEAVQEVLT